MADSIRSYWSRISWGSVALLILSHSLLVWMYFYELDEVPLIIIGLVCLSSYRVLYLGIFRLRYFIDGFENGPKGLVLKYLLFNKDRSILIDRSHLKIKGRINLSINGIKSEIWSTIIIKHKKKRIKAILPNEECSRFFANAFQYTPDSIDKTALRHIIYERMYIEDDTLRKQIELIKVYLEK